MGNKLDQKNLYRSLNLSSYHSLSNHHQGRETVPFGNNPGSSLFNLHPFPGTSSLLVAEKAQIKMIKSKPWNWDIVSAGPWWLEPASEVYPLISRWKSKGFKKFLDLGCGLGRHSILFAKEGFDVSATDLGKEGLEKLKNRAKEQGLPIEIKLADMVSLPYEDSSFDCLLAFHTIYHQDDEGIKKVIREIKRVLKDKGEAFITFNSKENSTFKDRGAKRISDNTLIKTKGHEAGIPHYYADKTDVENLLKDFKIRELFYKEEPYSEYTSTHFFVLVQK